MLPKSRRSRVRRNLPCHSLQLHPDCTPQWSSSSEWNLKKWRRNPKQRPRRKEVEDRGRTRPAGTNLDHLPSIVADRRDRLVRRVKHPARAVGHEADVLPAAPDTDCNRGCHIPRCAPAARRRSRRPSARGGPGAPGRAAEAQPVRPRARPPSWRRPSAHRAATPARCLSGQGSSGGHTLSGAAQPQVVDRTG